MKTLNISISELEYNKFGIKREKLSFTEFVELISKELSRQTLENCIELSEKYSLSKMTMENISKEVISVRKNAKKIVLDTTVLVSYLIQRNYPYFILRGLVLGNKVELYIL